MRPRLEEKRGGPQSAPRGKTIETGDTEIKPLDLTPALPAHGDPEGLGESPWEEAGQAEGVSILRREIPAQTPAGSDPRTEAEAAQGQGRERHVSPVCAELNLCRQLVPTDGILTRFQSSPASLRPFVRKPLIAI